MRRFKCGDIVVFQKPKVSTSPGPRAKDIDPAEHGESYSYTVDKFWVVAEVHDGELVLRTRKGKEHHISVDDQRLRRPRWWERIFYRSRFPSLDT